MASGAYASGPLIDALEITATWGVGLCEPFLVDIVGPCGRAMIDVQQPFLSGRSGDVVGFDLIVSSDAIRSGETCFVDWEVQSAGGQAPLTDAGSGWTGQVTLTAANPQATVQNLAAQIPNDFATNWGGMGRLDVAGTLLDGAATPVAGAVVTPGGADVYLPCQCAAAAMGQQPIVVGAGPQNFMAGFDNVSTGPCDYSTVVAQINAPSQPNTGIPTVQIGGSPEAFAAVPTGGSRILLNTTAEIAAGQDTFGDLPALRLFVIETETTCETDFTVCAIPNANTSTTFKEWLPATSFETLAIFEVTLDAGDEFDTRRVQESFHPEDGPWLDGCYYPGSFVPEVDWTQAQYMATTNVSGDRFNDRVGYPTQAVRWLRGDPANFTAGMQQALAQNAVTSPPVMGPGDSCSLLYPPQHVSIECETDVWVQFDTGHLEYHIYQTEVEAVRDNASKREVRP